MYKGMLTEMNLNGTSDFVVLAHESQHAVSQMCYISMTYHIKLNLQQ